MKTIRFVPMLLLMGIMGCQSLDNQQADAETQEQMASEYEAEQQGVRKLDPYGQPIVVGQSCVTPSGRRCGVWGDMPVAVPCRCGDEQGTVK